MTASLIVIALSYMATKTRNSLEEPKTARTHPNSKCFAADLNGDHQLAEHSRSLLPLTGVAVVPHLQGY